MYLHPRTPRSCMYFELFFLLNNVRVQCSLKNDSIQDRVTFVTSSWKSKYVAQIHCCFMLEEVQTRLVRHICMNCINERRESTDRYIPTDSFPQITVPNQHSKNLTNPYYIKLHMSGKNASCSWKKLLSNWVISEELRIWTELRFPQMCYFIAWSNPYSLLVVFTMNFLDLEIKHPKLSALCTTYLGVLMKLWWWWGGGVYIFQKLCKARFLPHMKQRGDWGAHKFMISGFTATTTTAAATHQRFLGYFHYRLREKATMTTVWQLLLLKVA